VEEFHGKISKIDQVYQEQAQHLRTEYAKAMSRLDNMGLQTGDLSLRLWANRAVRVTLESESGWLALFKEEFELPRPLAELNAEALDAVNTLRERRMEDLAAAKTWALDDLKALEKQQVREDRIEEARNTRATTAHIEESKAYLKIEKRLKRFTAEHAQNDIRNREKKQEWDPIPPPDARFPFRKENPVFDAFLQAVRVESSGFHDGPSAMIAVGNAIHYSGTRGLAVVAVHGSEVLIRDTYDTYAFEEESNRLIGDLKALPYGTFLILAVRDDATRRFTGSADSTLIRFGSGTGIRNLPYRSSYLMLGLKGLPPGQAVEMHGMGIIQYPSFPDPVEQMKSKDVNVLPPEHESVCSDELWDLNTYHPPIIPE
jgi:hypothetical protein